MNIEQLKAANPIERVAARYATLHRAGANYKMLCPFHNDHHPSLMLHVGKQFFKCHACGAGGDVIALVMGMEKCSFAEAVGILTAGATAGSTSVTHPLPPLQRGKVTPDTTTEANSKASNISSQDQQGVTPSPLERGQGVCNLLSANQQFLQSLLPCASGHSELSPTWLDFGVGLAPAFVPDAFRAMRSRIVFPIYDAEKMLTGFGARRIDNGLPDAAADSSPKYINTANDGLFDKSRTLYGIHRATEAIRKEGFVFMVEGYKDVLAMHAAGFYHTVALCGTALTDGQAEILSCYTSCLHLLLDGDGPGQKAAAKIAAERQRQFSVRTSSIPGGEDPDELFRRLGKAGFRTYLHHLTAQGCYSARRLLGYCLRQPSLAPLLEGMLEADDMRFADSDYNDLLHCLALQEECPEELQVFAGYLEELLPELFPALPELPGVPEGMTDEQIPLSHEVMLRILLTEYYEEKIIGEGRRLRRQIQSVDPADRPTLFRDLHRQLRHLSQITREAERTAAVDERWF